MSLIDFAQRLAEIEATVGRTEQKVYDLSNAMQGIKGPMDQMISDAEAFGSAVGRVGGQVVEMVSLAQNNWTPALQAVQWQLYEVQRAAGETEVVSREVLDKISNLVDERMPNFGLWLKKILQMRADGELTLDEMQKKIDDFATSVGVTQLNSMYHNDIPGFVIEFRKLMGEMEGGEEMLNRAADLFDRITNKARAAAKEVEKVQETTGGKGGGPGGSKGSSGTGDADGDVSGKSSDAALKAVAAKFAGAAKR